MFPVYGRLWKSDFATNINLTFVHYSTLQIAIAFKIKFEERVCFKVNKKSGYKILFIVINYKLRR